MNSISIGYPLVFKSEVLVTLASAIADGAPLLLPIPLSDFTELLSFWASGVAAVEAFRLSIRLNVC